MKKIINLFIVLFLFLAVIIIIFLSTSGIETTKFNKLISQKVNNANENISLSFNTIKFKLDLSEIDLFLEAKKPKVNFNGTIIPVKNIKVYINFFSLLKSENKIEKININLEQINIQQIKNISPILKPSNMTSFINNRITNGLLNTKIEIYFDKNNQLENFIARGSVSELKILIKKDTYLENTKFRFFADNSDVIINDFTSNIGPLKIDKGDIKIQISNEIILETNFSSNIQYNYEFKKYLSFVKNQSFIKNVSNLEANLDNNLSIHFDKTYKVKKYAFKNRGKIISANYKSKNIKENLFSKLNFENLRIVDTEVKTILSSDKKNINLQGKYSFNNNNFLNFNLENEFNREILNLKLDAEYKQDLKIDIINYNKSKDNIANIYLDASKKKDDFVLNKIDFKEGKNFISVEGVKFQKKVISSLEKISIKTFSDNKKNNEFTISNGKSILITGKKFDARNLPKILNIKNSKNNLPNLTKDIKVELKSVIVPLSEKLKNFRLIGKIESGKFIKISSKGDFGNNNFLDISMKNDKKKQIKYLEIYSDITQPLLTEYSFFKGLTGGKLLYTSVISENSTNSKLKIENFKVINAPGMVKLLSLADLGGLADLAEGEGISFEVLDINMNKTGEILNYSEILAIGPSISVLMEGYQDKNVTSLRGTLVPAKTLNQMISKIPVIGDIVIPKEVGEGLFGISFKMKGPPGKIKTSINPIRTITPRFIQKILDKNRKSK